MIVDNFMGIFVLCMMMKRNWTISNVWNNRFL